MTTQTLNKCAFSIPYTRHHLKFIQEVSGVFNRIQLPYRTEVRDEWEAQQSFLDFFTDEASVNYAAAFVGIISESGDSEEVVGAIQEKYQEVSGDRDRQG